MAAATENDDLEKTARPLCRNANNLIRPIPEERCVNLFAGSKSYEAVELQLKYELVANAETSLVNKQDFVPHYSDRHKVGFFSQDRCSQTELSDVVNVKEMTIVVSQLLKEIANLKKDILISKQMMMSDYKSSIEKKSLELYVRVNTRVAELETMHTDKVAVIRRAYKQQLTDALISIRRLYKKKMENQMRRIHKLMRESMEAGEVESLRATVSRSESVISVLQLQLEAARAQANRCRMKIINDELKEENLRIDTRLKLLEEELHAKDLTVTELKDQLGRSRDASERATRMAEQMRADLDLMTTSSLKSDAHRMVKEKKRMEMVLRAELEQEMENKFSAATARSLKVDKSYTNKGMLLSGARSEITDKMSKRDVSRLVESQRREMEKEMQRKIQEVYDSTDGRDKKSINDLRKVNRSFEEKIKHLEKKLSQVSAERSQLELEQKESETREQQLRENQTLQLSRPTSPRTHHGKTSEKAGEHGPGHKKKVSPILKRKAPSPLTTNMIAVAADDRDKLKAEIERLKKELERVHKVWETKFTVLQLSLHALKDESYIRHSLEKQSAPLHRNKIDLYHKEKSHRKKSNLNIPLPGIGMSHHSHDDLHGRFSQPLIVDEQQIMASSQHLPVDFQALPPPPSNRSSDGESKHDIIRLVV